MKKLNLKRLLKKKNNGGFTLVEVIISCALLGILVIGLFSFATPVMNMVSSGKKNARATMLAETIDSYIAGMLKNAKLVEVFQYTPTFKTTFAGSMGLKGAASGDLNKGLNKIDKFMQEGDNKNKYEVCCIGISWMEDSRRAGQRKLMITNNKVDTATATYTLRLTNIAKVFDDVLYDGLYPIIRLENFGVVSTPSSTSTSAPAASTSSGGTPSTTWAGGYKILCDIYADNTCYNVESPEARLQSRLAFRSASYVKCLNMAEPASDIINMSDTGDVQDAIDTNKGWNVSSPVPGVINGEIKYIENDKEYFYPDTYIYFVVPKKSTTTTTPTPTPTPTP